MASRTDQLHSYQFMVQRVVAALVLRETDPAQSPFRRIAGSTLIGVLVASLALGGVAVYGLFAPGGSKSWKNPDAVIMEKETGALFVYRKDDGKLHPVLNYASGLLLVGKYGSTVKVAHNSLNGAPRGSTLGIAGVPGSLPGRKQLRRNAWTVCSARPADGGAAKSTLFVASGVGNSGQVLAEGGGAPKAALVSTPDGAKYLISQRYRHLVRDPDVLLSAVWNGQAVEVAPAFVNALPAGVDVIRVATAIPNFGAAVSKPKDGKIGMVYSVERLNNDGYDYYVVTGSGLASLTPLQMKLLMSDPLYTTRIGRGSAVNLNRSDLVQFGTNIPPFQATSGAGALPSNTPALDPAASAGALCVGVAGAKGVTGVRVGVSLPDTTAADTTGSRTAGGSVLADRVMVPPGSGVLVATDGRTNAESGMVSLVTDTRVRYAVPTAEVRKMLGFGSVTPVQLPPEVVSLLPAGQALDPAAASNPVPAS